MAAVVDIYNLAIQKLGAARIATINDDTRAQRSCTACYAHLRDMELRSRAWKFSIRRASLQASTAIPIGLIDLVFPSTNAFLLPTDCLRVLFPPRTYNDWVIEAVSLNALATGTALATSTTAVVGSGTAFTTDFTVGAQIIIQGQTHTVTVITSNTNLTVDQAFNNVLAGAAIRKLTGVQAPAIITNDGPPLGIRYIAQITDTTQFDESFVEMLACKMAAHMCEELTQSNTKQATVNAQYAEAQSMARQMNSYEMLPVNAAEDSWGAARRTGSSQAPWLRRQNG